MELSPDKVDLNFTSFIPNVLVLEHNLQISEVYTEILVKYEVKLRISEIYTEILVSTSTLGVGGRLHVSIIAG